MGCPEGYSKWIGIAQRRASNRQTPPARRGDDRFSCHRRQDSTIPHRRRRAGATPPARTWRFETERPGSTRLMLGCHRACGKLMSPPLHIVLNTTAMITTTSNVFARSRKHVARVAEGEGLEPSRACARRFSRPLPYQLGLALQRVAVAHTASSCDSAAARTARCYPSDPGVCATPTGSHASPSSRIVMCLAIRSMFSRLPVPRPCRVTLSVPLAAARRRASWPWSPRASATARAAVIESPAPR